jgi:hypothetical protein
MAKAPNSAPVSDGVEFFVGLTIPLLKLSPRSLLSRSRLSKVSAGRPTQSPTGELKSGNRLHLAIGYKVSEITALHTGQRRWFSCQP